MRKTTIQLDGYRYRVTIKQTVTSAPDVPRLLIPAYVPNATASDILRVCIRSIQQYTTIPYELWVVDNRSPQEYTAWLADEPDINVVFNHTLPVPPEHRRWWHRMKPPLAHARTWGSYSNAIGLELGRACIPTSSQWLMTLHQDTMPVADHWLQYLKAQCTATIRASGVRMDTARVAEGVLHVLGYLVDYQVFQQIGADFFPDLPAYDVGDRVTVKLRQAGYDVVACRNTLWQPDLIEQLPPASPYRELHVDRTLDADDNVIFLHLGRGVQKTHFGYDKGTSPQAWLSFAHQHILH